MWAQVDEEPIKYFSSVFLAVADSKFAVCTIRALQLDLAMDRGKGRNKHENGKDADSPLGQQSGVNGRPVVCYVIAVGRLGLVYLHMAVVLARRMQRLEDVHLVKLQALVAPGTSTATWRTVKGRAERSIHLGRQNTVRFDTLVAWRQDG